MCVSVCVCVCLWAHEAQTQEPAPTPKGLVGGGRRGIISGPCVCSVWGPKVGLAPRHGAELRRASLPLPGGSRRSFGGALQTAAQRALSDARGGGGGCSPPGCAGAGRCPAPAHRAGVQLAGPAKLRAPNVVTLAVCTPPGTDVGAGGPHRSEEENRTFGARASRRGDGHAWRGGRRQTPPHAVCARARGERAAGPATAPRDRPGGALGSRSPQTELTLQTYLGCKAFVKYAPPKKFPHFFLICDFGSRGVNKAPARAARGGSCWRVNYAGLHFCAH